MKSDQLNNYLLSCPIDKKEFDVLFKKIADNLHLLLAQKNNEFLKKIKL